MQILADIFTFLEKRGAIQDRVVAFIGDGACNVVNSWVFAAASLDSSSGSPPRRFPAFPDLLKRAGGRVVCVKDVKTAATGAIYFTGCGSRWARKRIRSPVGIFGRLSNQRIPVKLARPGALVMHCLPAYRGKEIDEATFEANADTIFDEAEKSIARAEVDFELANILTFRDRLITRVQSHFPGGSSVPAQIFQPNLDVLWPWRADGQRFIGHRMGEEHLLAMERWTGNERRSTRASFSDNQA